MVEQAIEKKGHIKCVETPPKSEEIKVMCKEGHAKVVMDSKVNNANQISCIQCSNQIVVDDGFYHCE